MGPERVDGVADPRGPELMSLNKGELLKLKTELVRTVVNQHRSFKAIFLSE